MKRKHACNDEPAAFIEEGTGVSWKVSKTGMMESGEFQSRAGAHDLTTLHQLRVCACRFQEKSEHVERFAGLLPESHGQNLALTEVCVPSSLDSGTHHSESESCAGLQP